MAEKIYLIGSLRNPEVPVLAESLREQGFDVFDDWYSAGPEADDYWMKYEQSRGHGYAQALEGYAANHVYLFDKHHLDSSQVGILLLPAGRSGHLELGYMKGRGKHCYIWKTPQTEPDRWDVMYRFADAVVSDMTSFLRAHKGAKR
jgi:hypothetical protein